MLTQVLPFR